MKTILFAFYSIWFVGTDFAAMGWPETNELYVTENQYVHVIYMDNGESHHDDLMIAARKTRESYPAKDFPEGNWGSVEHGFQLSLRFAKPYYTNGEPISATLLLRNVTAPNTNNFSYFPYTATCDGPADFHIVSASGGAATGHPPVMPGMAPKSRSAPQMKEQHKIVEHVNSGYDLNCGTYDIQATIKIIYDGTNNWEHFEVKSAKVPIEIK